MKKLSIALLALATTIAITPAALADSFNYTFADNTINATGTLTGSQISNGVWLITSGTINLTGANDCNNCGLTSVSMDGTGYLINPAPNSGFEVGGGTNLTGLDNLLYLGSNPQLDDEGLAFRMDSPLQQADQIGIAIWGNGTSAYSIFGGNWTINDQNGGGSFSATLAPTPEPSSLMLLGTGLIGLAAVARRRFLSA